MLIKAGGYGDKVYGTDISPPDEHCFNNLVEAAEYILNSKK